MRFPRNVVKHTLVSSVILNCLHKYIRDLISDELERKEENLKCNGYAEPHPAWMSKTMYDFDISKSKNEAGD